MTIKKHLRLQDQFGSWKEEWNPATRPFQNRIMKWAGKYTAEPFANRETY